MIRKFAMPNFFFFFLLLILRILVGCNLSYLIDGLSSYIIILFADNIGKIENATTDVDHACFKLEVLRGITHTNNIYDIGPIKRVRLLTVLFCLYFVFIFCLI